MSIFKTVGSYLFGNKALEKEELRINNGLLCKYNPKVNKSFNAIYIDSDMLIFKTNQENLYQLIIARVIEEGEEDNTDDLDFERTFLISEEMDFKYQKSSIDGENFHTFKWNHHDDDDDLIVYEFRVSTKEVDENSVKNFMDAFSLIVAGMKSLPSKQIPSKNEIDSITKQLEVITLDADEEKEDNKPSKEAFLPQNAKLITDIKGELRTFNSFDGIYELVGKVKVAIYQEPHAMLRYWLSIESMKSTKDIIACVQLNPLLNPRFSNKSRTFSFVELRGANILSWLVNFDKDQDEIKFKEFLLKALYETFNQGQLDEMNELDQDYIEKSYIIVDDSEDDEVEVLEETENEEENEELYSDSASESGFSKGSAKNSQLAMGYKVDRSFVSRGPNIGVFKHGDRNKMEFIATIKNIKDSKGNLVNPNKMLIREQDSSMMLIDPENPNKMYVLDIETGTIGQEIDVDKNIQCSDIFAKSKYSQLTPEKTLYGISHNSMFTIDPRIGNSNIIVNSEMKQYVKSPNFSCAVTTANGEIAAASETGEIRLYNQIGKSAKTLLPAIGENIFALDVSNDGQYLLATCKNFILVIDCLVKSDDKKRTGFNISFPKSEKPIPKRLQLKPEDIASMGQEVNFTPARFNAGEDILEKYIVSSTGNYLILWNFRQVKLGHPYAYHLIKYEHNVVADNFRFNQDKSIVVTLPNDVTITGQSRFSAPKDLFKKKSKS